ncbi:hypothetical protein BDW71DRAFT_101056 [Aspergillus fruticulosus]
MRTSVIEGTLQRMADFGILPGKGITIVPHEVLTDALGRIVDDEGCIRSIQFCRACRAIAIVPEGTVDIGDDIEGAYGGPALVELMALRKAAGISCTARILPPPLTVHSRHPWRTSSSRRCFAGS